MESFVKEIKLPCLFPLSAQSPKDTIKSNQINSNQFKSNQIKSNQIKSTQFYLYSPKSKSHCVSGLYNVYIRPSDPRSE